MSTLQKILAILTLTQLSCQRQVLYVPDFSNYIHYDSREIKYSGSTIIPENVISYKFFNQSGQLIEQVGHEHRIRYFYDSVGELIEKYNCRMFNCDIGWRELIIYDDNKNVVGIYRTLDTVVDLDTVQYEQTKFYDERGKKSQELIDKGSSMQGEKYEIWRGYSYVDQYISKDYDMNNGDTTWIGNYNYDDKGNLININRILGKFKEETDFVYNKNGLLIKKTIESN